MGEDDTGQGSGGDDKLGQHEDGRPTRSSKTDAGVARELTSPTLEEKVGRGLGLIFGRAGKSRLWQKTVQAYRDGLEGQKR